jgi:hypothetical protein
MKKIFVIEDRFEINGRGIALIGVTDDDSMEFKKGDVALIKQANSHDIHVEVLGFELMRNTWSPDKPRNMSILVPSDTDIENISFKSEVWSSRASRFQAIEGY